MSNVCFNPTTEAVGKARSAMSEMHIIFVRLIIIGCVMVAFLVNAMEAREARGDVAFV